MITSFFANITQALVCKHLSKLPPVVCDWQHCQRPRCPHYCQGECCNPNRQATFAPCPFDGKDLPLEADGDTDCSRH